MLIYQFLSLNNQINIIHQILNRNQKTGVRTILDLEDSLDIPGQPKKAAEYRMAAREKLLKEITPVIPLTYTGVRINHISSNDVSEDIACLEQSEVLFDHVMLPKVNTAKELHAYVKALKFVEYKELIIILETVEGVEAIHEILDAARSLGINKIQFGHWDYFLSMGAYPIPKQHTSIFWSLATTLIKTIEGKGLTYLHPPLNNLVDFQSISDVIHHLKQICRTTFGFNTLTNGQTRQALRKDIIAQPLQLHDDEINDKVSHARNVVNEFRSRQYSFDIQSRQVFVAPHDYRAAQNFLSKWNLL